MAFDAGSVIELIVSIIIVALVFWIVGRILVGKQKANIGHAFWIAILGIIINYILQMFIPGIIGFIVTCIVWLWLIKHFFETGWLHAIIIAVAAIIVLVIVEAILGALGFGMLAGYLHARV